MIKAIAILLAIISSTWASAATNYAVMVDGAGNVVYPPGWIMPTQAMGGDVTGNSTNASVVKVRGVPVGVLTPGAGTDGYGLKYDHPSGGFVLGPVASESGSFSNLLTLSGTAVKTDVDGQEIGMYRSVRPGYLPTAVINVGGYEAVYLDLLGITLRSGSLYLLNDVLSVNVAAYDGSVTQPAYTWNEQRHLGKYRLSYDGGYGEGFTVSSNLVWFWAADGIHLQPGKQIFGLPYADQITVVSQRVDNVEGWGDHSQSGYASTVTVAQVAADVGAISQRVDTVEGWGDHSQSGYASTVTVAQVAADVGAISQRVDTVEGWGDHGQAGYASTVTVAQVAADMGAVSQRVDNVEGWGDHSQAGYASQDTGEMELVSNGSFAAGTNYWTLDEGIGISGGVALWDGSQSGAQLKQMLNVSSGRTYRVQTMAAVNNPHKYTIWLGSQSVGQVTASGTNTATIVATEDNAELIIEGWDQSIFFVSSVSVVDIDARTQIAPGVVTIGTNTITAGDVRLWNLTAGKAWSPAALATNTPTAVPPRWVGDELVIHDSTQMIYRAFGLTTNDWVQTWP